MTGQRFTNENNGFRTNTARGGPHGPGTARGSALAMPLDSDATGTLWLEHVVSREGDAQWYWLMWYDMQGRPLTRTSAVFRREHLRRMVDALLAFVPL